MTVRVVIKGINKQNGDVLCCLGERRNEALLVFRSVDVVNKIIIIKLKKNNSRKIKLSKVYLPTASYPYTLTIDYIVCLCFNLVINYKYLRYLYLLVMYLL